MTSSGKTQDNPGTLLCKSCGLCCSGHLFIWAKLRPSELDPAEALGMTVYRDDPNQRGFSQPCPVWKGECTIYESARYPHVCRAYRCKLLKEVLAGHRPLSNALDAIGQAKESIQELERRLPNPSLPNFRERLVTYLEHPEQFTSLDASNPHLREKANALLALYEQVFGVDDLIEGDGD